MPSRSPAAGGPPLVHVGIGDRERVDVRITLLEYSVTTPGAQRDPRDVGTVMCSCGDRLADRIDGGTVVINGMEFQFRRRSDEMTSGSCGFFHPMRQFRRTVPGIPDTGQRRRRDDR